MSSEPINFSDVSDTLQALIENGAPLGSTLNKLASTGKGSRSPAKIKAKEALNNAILKLLQFGQEMYTPNNTAEALKGHGAKHVPGISILGLVLSVIKNDATTILDEYKRDIITETESKGGKPLQKKRAVKNSKKSSLNKQ